MDTIAKIRFVKPCGHHKKDAVESVDQKAAMQYMVSGYAELYKEDAVQIVKPELEKILETEEAQEPEPEKKPSRAKKAKND